MQAITTIWLPETLGIQMMATLDQAEDFYQGKNAVSPEDTKRSPRSSLSSVSHRTSVSLTSL